MASDGPGKGRPQGREDREAVQESGPRLDSEFQIQKKRGCVKGILRNKASKFFVSNKSFPQKPKANVTRGRGPEPQLQPLAVPVAGDVA